MIWNMVQTARTCVVTFKSSVDESVLYTVEVDAGSSVTYGGKTPTKSSTAQYTYTFSGWSRTKGGNAVSGILNDIEEDIVLWSAFTSTVRKYTITWKNYDGSTIGTTSVAYGSVPSHAAVKFGGYTSTGWNPTPKAVTGTATYTATYILPQGMSETISKDWDQIIADSKANNTSGYHNGGLTKVMLLADSGALCFELVGVNQDTAGHFTFISKTLVGNCVWSSSDTTGGYPSSNYKKVLESTVLNKVPSNIQSAMKTVKKYCYSYSPKNNALSYTAKIWAPCTYEFCEPYNETSGPKYMHYNFNGYDDGRKHRIRYTADGVAATAWLSTAGNIISNATYLTTGGSMMSGSCQTARGAFFGFCL